jgi:predicted CXXCH cytochrome family protein
MRSVNLLGLSLLVVAPLQAQQRTRSPHGDLKLECMTCHISSGWTPIRVAKTFDHAKVGGFALAGAHGTTTCRACHQSLDFKGVKSDCVSCHVDKHRGELGATCARCHTARSFVDRDLMTKAHQVTRFPLRGGHLGVECSSCHKPGAQGSLQFVGTQLECVSCHRADFNTAPNHVAGNFPTTCAGCHNQVAWNRVAGLAAGNHPTTPLALTGVHANSQCTDCHLAGQAYAAVRQTCDGCHHTDFVGAKDPDHVAAAFSTTCTTCHALVPGWMGATYATHSKTPIDPKQGAHGAVTCTQCHTKSPYSSAPTTCDGCHHADYVATTNPGHAAAGYSIDCASCHQVVAGWAGASINHPTSPIALAGVHGHSQCTDCHLAGQAYSAVKQTCDGCHHTDFVAAKDPDHVAAGFSTNCTTCHALVAGWTGATYATHSTTPIDPKQGAHGAVTCTQCHTKSPYSSAPTTCDGCHHADYVATTNPNHTTAGYSTDCASCHQVVAGWAGASFNHPTSPLALTGSHAIPPRACADCHKTTSYSSVAQTCDGCHHSDYIGVTDPNHTAAGMSDFAAANCSNCHSPSKSSWSGPTWTHMTIVNPQPVRLPHEGASCADCHQTLTNYTITSCAKSGCHSKSTGPS